MADHLARISKIIASAEDAADLRRVARAFVVASEALATAGLGHASGRAGRRTTRTAAADVETIFPDDRLRAT